MDAITLKMAVRNAVKEALEENLSKQYEYPPFMTSWYNKILKQIENIKNKKFQQELSNQLLDFFSIDHSTQVLILKKIESEIKKFYNA